VIGQGQVAGYKVPLRDIRCKGLGDLVHDETPRTMLEALRRDYASVMGKPFAHFYCPILFRDEDVTLIKGHIVNQAFPNAPPNWTVQRKDVDQFFGSVFESDFTVLQYKGNYSPGEILVDPRLSKKLHPRIERDGEPIGHYFPQGQVPEEHTKVEFQTPAGSIPLVVKLRPDEALTLKADSLQILVGEDLRLPALVSLIKVAHLTLFELLGYRWPLSAAGYYVGYTILGNFFLKNSTGTKQARKQRVLLSAQSHFAEFQNMVRPVVSAGPFLPI
jgi:hypothetical protein